MSLCVCVCVCVCAACCINRWFRLLGSCNVPTYYDVPVCLSVCLCVGGMVVGQSHECLCAPLTEVATDRPTLCGCLSCQSTAWIGQTRELSFSRVRTVRISLTTAYVHPSPTHPPPPTRRRLFACSPPSIHPSTQPAAVHNLTSVLQCYCWLVSHSLHVHRCSVARRCPVRLLVVVVVVLVVRRLSAGRLAQQHRQRHHTARPAALYVARRYAAPPVAILLEPYQRRTDKAAAHRTCGAAYGDDDAEDDQDDQPEGLAVLR
mmetsp:Transcript_17095/g.48567  ORF Transcript_17095/g.48567 Transcript_17095/m.48567 type:complete len:261 (-) Transcript_17095:63-845(-)